MNICIFIKKYMFRYLFSIIVIFSVLISCTEENKEYFKSKDEDYYPLINGKYNIYKVTEINIDVPSDVYDTTVYQLKEMIGGSYTDNEGNTAFVLVRYKRNDTNEVWNVSDVWSVQNVDDRLLVSEENYRYVKIIFPLEKDKTWDGNAYNIKDNEEYEISSVNQADIINGMTFDSVMKVSHIADSSLIHKDIKYEKYAIDTGLVVKKEIHMESQEVIPDVPLEGRLNTATIYKQKFISSGKAINYEIQ